MNKRFLFFFLLSGLVLMNACQKEYSLENGNNPSEGTLQDDGTGDCLPKTVAGAYIVGTALAGATNYIEVQVNVTTVGSYTIFTDTVNGMHFRGSGVFSTLGLNTVRLQGVGTPFAANISNFLVNYGSSSCTIAVTTVSSLAAFTLNGAPGGCMGAVVAGTYTVGTALNAGNTVTISVIVTSPGAYNLTTGPTASNGMIFSGSGILASGPQTIVLTGSGTPITAGPPATNIPVTAGSSTCSFTVNVVAAAPPATFTINCGSAVVNGTYTVGTALTAANTVSITVDVTVAGSYSITGTAGGMTFAASGTFAVTGTAQPVTLIGTSGAGGPTTQGPNSVPLTGGTASCNITVTVNPATAGAAIFAVNCGTAIVNGTYTQNTILAATNTVTLSVTVTTAGTYNAVTTTATNGMVFSSGTGGTWAAGAQTLTLTGSGTPTAAGTFFIPVTAGTTPCNFLVIVASTSTDYFPRVTNDNWSYEFDDDAADSIYRKVISPTFSALGNTYNIFMQDAGTGFDSSGYYRKNGGDYLEYLDVGSFIGYDNPQRAEYIMLKDNVALNTNWKSAGFTGTVSGTPLTIRFSYTIVQKDLPTTVVSSATGSITYQNVIAVEEKYEQFTGGIWVDITSLIDFYGKSYYARGIGLIKYEPYNAAGTIQTGKMELRRYIVY